MVSGLQLRGTTVDLLLLAMERANMGRRRKVEMRKIENKSSRQVTFSKRRKGMLKKAQELSVLCDAEVAAVIFSATGKLYQSCTAQSLPEMLERYRYCVGSSDINQNPSEEENCHSRLTSIQKCAELLQILDRNLEESHIDNLSVTELVQLEKQLDDALTETTSRKTQMLLQSISALREKENMLQEEKEMLQKEIAAVLEDGRALEEMNSNKNDLGHPSDLPPQQQHATLNLLC